MRERFNLSKIIPHQGRVAFSLESQRQRAQQGISAAKRGPCVAREEAKTLGDLT